MSDAITVSLNGNSEAIESGQSLQHALQQWDLADKKVATAINGDFVPRSRYANTRLNNGDQIDVVAPVGGG